jgi:hypothetical protein
LLLGLASRRLTMGGGFLYVAIPSFALVVLSWFAWPRPASRGRAALLTGLACLLLAPLLVGAALYLPLLQMGALI